MKRTVALGAVATSEPRAFPTSVAAVVSVALPEFISLRGVKAVSLLAVDWGVVVPLGREP